MNEARHKADADTRRRWFRRAANLNLLLGLTFTAIFLYFAVRAQFTVPYVDDWSSLASLQDHPFTKWLWQPHNEHIIVIPRLLLWVDLWIWGWPGYATLLAALLSHAAIAGMLIRACRDRPRDEARLLSGSVLLLMFLTYELQGAVFPGAVSFPLVLAFSTLAFACLAKCAEKASQPSISPWATASAVSSVMAMLCLTNGLIVPLILAGLSWLLRLPRRTTTMFLIIGVAGVIIRYELGGVPSTVAVWSVAAVVRFGLATLAGPIASVSPQLAVIVGGFFSVLALRALWQFVRTDVRPPAAALLVGNILLVMASAAMAALGRAQFDLSVGAESRYTEFAALGWASLLLVALPTGIINLPIGRMAAGVLPVVALAALPVQVFVGQVWAAKADHLDVASLVLTVGVKDDDWIWRINPLGSGYIDPVLPQLRARNVKFLAFPERGLKTVNLPPPAVECTGRLDGIVPLKTNPGLRVLGHIRERGEALRIVDGESRVRGLAKPAPLVQEGRASANDFVWAELEVLRGTRPSAGDWLGFAAWGSGPPFRAELVDRGRQVVCQLPIQCCREASPPPSRRELIVRGGLPEGWLEAADCTLIGGWAWDAVRPSQTVDVSIAISNGEHMTVAASAFRQDLLDSGKGNGQHGFTLTAPYAKLGAGTWRVSASIATTGVPLNGSPKTIVCPE